MDRTTGLEPDNGMDAYVYSPLTHPSAFRVLRLSAGSDQDKASFTLEQRIVEDVGDYEALSYTWGDTTEKRPTICCNMSFNITQHLFCALHHLRYADRERVIWIDAVCINQESIPERNQQVSMMGDIYKSARQVVIWLGEDWEGGDTVDVFDSVLYELSANERDEWMNRYSVPDYEDSLGDERLWRSLEWLFGLPRFRHVWVLQEASSAIFMLGQQTLP
jgi:hypothetical protein